MWTLLDNIIKLLKSRFKLFKGKFSNSDIGLDIWSTLSSVYCLILGMDCDFIELTNVKIPKHSMWLHESLPYWYQCEKQKRDTAWANSYFLNTSTVLLSLRSQTASTVYVIIPRIFFTESTAHFKVYSNPAHARSSRAYGRSEKLLRDCGIHCKLLKLNQ